MALTNIGAVSIAENLVGTGTRYDNGHAYLGVGNSDAAFDATQTDLKGSSKLRKPMDPGYPKIVDNVITYRATFTPAEANFPWKEWGLFNAPTGGKMLNRVIESNGTKQSNQTWILEVTETISV